MVRIWRDTCPPRRGPEGGALEPEGWGKVQGPPKITQPLSARFRQPNSRERLWPGGLLAGNIFTQARVNAKLVCAESVMPLSSEQEELCRRLEMGRPEPSAAALIRQQARDIDELWDRLSRAYLAVRREMPGDELRREIEQLRAQLERQRTIA